MAMAKDSLGLIELTSIASGFLACDSMLKAADVSVVLSRSICSGKYMVMVRGDVAAVQAAVSAGVSGARFSVIEFGCNSMRPIAGQKLKPSHEWDPPLFPELIKRLDPEIFAVEDLQVDAGRGIVPYRPAAAAGGPIARPGGGPGFRERFCRHARGSIAPSRYFTAEHLLRVPYPRCMRLGPLSGGRRRG